MHDAATGDKKTVRVTELGEPFAEKVRIFHQIALLKAYPEKFFKLLSHVVQLNLL
jgi:hypothetical protein